MKFRMIRLCTLTLISLFLVFGLAAQAGARGYNYDILYAFCSGADYICTDGVYPQAGLIQDSAGNLYGTTTLGGANQSAPCGFLAPGCGTVFKVDSTGQETVLYSFCSSSEHVLYSFCDSGDCFDGQNPEAGLIQDASGNLYGTTSEGGGNLNANCINLDGTCGLVFALSTGNAAVTVTSAPNPSEVDQPVTFSVVVSGIVGVTPTGSVTFETGNTVLGTVMLAAGKASLTTTFHEKRSSIYPR